MNKIFTSGLLFLLVVIIAIYINYDNITAADTQTPANNISTSPNYSLVFPNDKVNRIDIKINAKQWAAMNSVLEKGKRPDRPMHDMRAEDLAEVEGNGKDKPSRRNRPPMPPENDGLAQKGNDTIQHKERGRRHAPPGGHMGGPPSNEKVKASWNYCDIYFNEQQWNKVGIRFKGNSSLRMTNQMGLKKFSFKLDFDEFEDDFPEIKNQRFYGFKQLNLKNNFGDPSFMREKVAADLFTEFGVTSPKTSFCQVYVDYGEGSQYFGMYTLVEEVDDTVIKTQYKGQKGNLYKPEGMGSTFANGSFNKADMNKKNNKKQENFADVEKLNELVNSSLRTENHELWKTQLSEVLDINIFLRWLAANSVIQNWDTYGVMSHNFYLYHNSASGKLEWIPWDNNEAFQHGKMGGAVTLSLTSIDDSWPLIRYIIDDEEWKGMYENYISDFVENVFTTEKMTTTYNKYQQLISPNVIGKHGEQTKYSFLRNDAEFGEAVNFLKTHVEERHFTTLDYLKNNSTTTTSSLQ